MRNYISHNTRLKKLIKSIQLKVKLADNEDMIFEAVKLAKNFEGGVSYKNKHLYIISFIFLVIVIYLFYLFNNNGFQHIYQFLILILSFIGGVLPLKNAISRNNDIDQISDFIFHKKLLLDNNISRLPVFDKQIQALPIRFVEFNRGNAGRSFKSAYKKDKLNEGLPNDIYLYTFEYINKREVRTNNVGRREHHGSSTKTVYERFYRYGLIYDFEYIKNFHVASNGMIRNKVDYNSASIDFSNKFTIGAPSDIYAAKILKPKVVLLIEQLSTEFKNINIEFDAMGLMCCSFSDKDILYTKRRFGLEQSTEFYKEIQDKKTLEKLSLLTKFIQELSIHSDNNFRSI